MRKIAALVFLAALATTPAFAQELPGFTGFYIQAYGGLRVPDNLKFDGTAQDLGIGTTLGGSIGLNTTLPGVSVDIDYLHSSATYSSFGTSLDSQSLMVDAQYAPTLAFGLQPYVGAGIGAVNVTYKSSDSGTAPAFQLKGGVSGNIMGPLSWFGEYRYQQAIGSLNIGSPTYPVEYASHSILGGLKFSFDGGSSGGGYTGY